MAPKKSNTRDKGAKVAPTIDDIIQDPLTATASKYWAFGDQV